MTDQNPPGFCGTGQQLRQEMQQHDRAIADAQRRMVAVRQAADSLDQQVPRSLHEALSTHISQRGLVNLQWGRHLRVCAACQAMENQASEAA